MANGSVNVLPSRACSEGVAYEGKQLVLVKFLGFGEGFFVEVKANVEDVKGK